MTARCTRQRADGRPCRLPARLDGVCLGHQPARPARQHDPAAPSTAERVQQRITELGAEYSRKTPVAITAQAWREIAAENITARVVNGTSP